jgi:predicted RNA binding protein YcfA (HicA-like mRNA interferase family)
MPKLPRVKVSVLIKFVESHGFVEAKHKGTSHVIFKHRDGRRTTIAIHGNKEIPIGTMHAILRDIEISRDIFIEYIENN